MEDFNWLPSIKCSVFTFSIRKWESLGRLQINGLKRFNWKIFRPRPRQYMCRWDEVINRALGLRINVGIVNVDGVTRYFRQTDVSHFQKCFKLLNGVHNEYYGSPIKVCGIISQLNWLHATWHSYDIKLSFQLEITDASQLRDNITYSLDA